MTGNYCSHYLLYIKFSSLLLQSNDASKSPSEYQDLPYTFPAPTVLYLKATSPPLGSYPI